MMSTKTEKNTNFSHTYYNQVINTHTVDKFGFNLFSRTSHYQLLHRRYASSHEIHILS